jgi:dCMP deaminase
MGDQITQQSPPADSSQSSPSPHLKPYHLYSWHPDESRSFDENYMDIVMILTRSVQFRQGSMGCIVVNEPNPPTKDYSKFFNGIIGANTNQALFTPNDSDIHAEIATLGSCLQNGISTKDATVYITMPPCKRCFGALCAAGIKRIVSSKEYVKAITDGAEARNIELVTMSGGFFNQQKDRISDLIKSDGQECNVTDERERRKEEKRKRKEHGKDGGGRIKVQNIL